MSGISTPRAIVSELMSSQIDPSWNIRIVFSRFCARICEEYSSTKRCVFWSSANTIETSKNSLFRSDLSLLPMHHIDAVTKREHFSAQPLPILHKTQECKRFMQRVGEIIILGELFGHQIHVYFARSLHPHSPS